MFDAAHIAAFELISLVFLLEELKIPIDLSFLLVIELPLHSGQGLLLSLLSHPTFIAFVVNALFEQLNLVFVVGFN